MSKAYKSKYFFKKCKMNMNRNHYQSSMVRVVGFGMHTVRGFLTSTFLQSLVGTVSQISCFFSVHSCLGTILQTGVEVSVHFFFGKGKQASLWIIHCVRGQSGFFDLVLTERNMQIKFDLRLSVYSLGVDI